jgi:hypothetical protein
MLPTTNLFDALVSATLDNEPSPFLIEQFLQDTFCQDIWEKETLKPDVRKTLLQIVDDFLMGLRGTPVSHKQIGAHERKGIIVEARDIIIAGSMANYNYTASSDIDLHISVNFAQVDPKLPVVNEFFADLVALWNEHHGIKIYNHPVELFVQDIYNRTMPPLVSAGLYSVMNNKWLKKPSKKEPSVDKAYVEKKAQPLMKQIDAACQLGANEAKAYEKLYALRVKLREMRTAALQKGGEYSVENLAFKLLRKRGYLQKLVTTERKAYDRMRSLP